MKPVHRIVSIILLIGIYVTPLSSTIQNDRRDGNWWVSLSKGYKSNYAVGFFDGMDLGHNFSYWGFSKDDPSCLSKVRESYSKYNEKYFREVTNGQIVDGLDVFYSDYKNRRILVSNATWLVVNGIAGMPKDELERMTENWRKNAAIR